ncbi:MAG: YbhN family protein [Anaerolineales bacterium]
MRKFLLAVALLLGIIFLIGQFSEVQTILQTLQKGDWRYLSLAFLVQMAWMGCVAASYWVIYRLLNLQEKFSVLFNLAAAANFVNVVAPTAGMGGMAVLVGHARQEEYSSGRAAIAGALFILFDYLGFMSVLAIGIFVLFRRNNLTWVEVSATLILVVIAVTLSVLLYLGTHSAEALGRALAWIARRVNVFTRLFVKRDSLSENRAQEFARDAAQGLMEIRAKPTNLLAPLGLALLNKLLLITVFTLIFLSFDVPFTPGTIIAGFSVSYLFLIVSPTPSGIGVVEGILTLTLRSLNVPLGAAAVIALAYRGVSFWFPLIIGMFSFRIMGGSKNIDTPQEFV